MKQHNYAKSWSSHMVWDHSLIELNPVQPELNLDIARAQAEAMAIDGVSTGGVTLV